MRFLRSCKYAWQGIRCCVLKGKNFKIQCIITLAIFPIGILFHLKSNEWLIILLCMALVLGLELVNTSIEKLADIVCQSIHPLIKQVKDIAAGAVFLASIAGCTAGIIIFLPKIELLLKHILK